VLDLAETNAQAPASTPAPAAAPAPAETKPLTRNERIKAAFAAVESKTEKTDAAAPPQPDAASTPPPQPAAAATSPKPEDKAAKRFAEAARREGELVAKQRALKAREAEAEKRLAEVRSAEETIKKAKAAPLAALKALGLSYEDVTQAVLNDGKPTPELEVRAVRDELAEWKAEQKRQAEETAKQTRERMQREAQEVRSDFEQEVSGFLAESAEYPLTKIRSTPGVVAAYIEGVYKRDRKLLTIKEAATAVEAFLVKQREAEDVALGKSKPAPAAAAQVATKPAAKPPERRSLTTDLVAETPAEFKTRPKTVAERHRAALELLNTGS
jgi:hypothetical protein